MSEGTIRVARKRPHRKRWFLLGVVAGMLLFPWAAGLPYRASWQRVGNRVASVARGGAAWAKPVVERAWKDVRGVFTREDSQERQSGASRRGRADPTVGAEKITDTSLTWSAQRPRMPLGGPGSSPEGVRGMISSSFLQAVQSRVACVLI